MHFIVRRFDCAVNDYFLANFPESVLVRKWKLVDISENYDKTLQ